MSGMPIPKWADNAKKQMFEEHGKLNYDGAGAKKVELVPVTSFSTFFAEYEIKDSDLLIHLFPRAGAEDRWYPEEYRDGKYIPARREEDTGTRFPENIEELVKGAADETWQGDIAVELASLLRYEEEADVKTDEPTEIDIGAYVVQFQNAKTSVTVVGIEKFVDKFCEALDARLDQ
jgi:hypothetical protein